MAESELTNALSEASCSRRTLLMGASALAAAAALSTLGPVNAFADSTATLVWPSPTGARDNTLDGKTVLKCYAPSTNTVLTEVLGLSNPSFYKQEYTDYVENLCKSPTLGVWGSSANAEPNVYLSNLIYKEQGKNVDDNYVAVLGSALQGASQNAEWDSEDGLPLLMKHRPDMYAIGDSDSWSKAGKTTAELIKTINAFEKGDGHYQEGDENYNPTFVDFRKYYGEKLGYMYSMWEVSAAAEKLMAADPTKTARYGAPSDQAARVEKFMVASQYAILRAISCGQVKRRVVAVVGGVSDQGTGVINGVDLTTGRARIDEFEPGNTSFNSATQWGTTTRFNVRYYHAASSLENVTDNITSLFPPVKGGDPAGNDPIIRDANGVLWARPEALMQCDAIIVRSQTTVTTIPGKDELFQILREYGYTNENKWPDIYTGYPVANGYGASNSGQYFWWYSYMTFVYPEIFNPVHMSHYLFNNIYHIADSYIPDAIEIICGNMSLPRGYELTSAGYSAENIEEEFSKGISWYMTNKEEIDRAYPNLKMTGFMANWLANNPEPEPEPEPEMVCPNLIDGKNEYAVMAAEIQSAWSKASTIVVVGSIYGAAVATPLAKQYGAPVIDAQAILKSYSTVASLVKKLGAKKYIVVGNKTAVPSKVESSLKRMGLSARTKRISGTNNTTLSLAVAKAKKTWGKTAVVASTSDLMGLMSATAYAAAVKAPVFIVGKKMSSSMKKALKSFSTAVVIGSTSVVSSSVAKAIPCKKVTRISGTSSKLAQAVVAKELGAGLKANNAILIAASGKSSAIAAASVATRKGVVLVPTYKASIDTPAKAVLAKKPTMLTVVGVIGNNTSDLFNAAQRKIN